MKHLKINYDEFSDVLYLSLNDPQPSESESEARGVELDFSMRDGSPSGVTVVGFKRNHWSKDLAPLCSIAASHLHLSPEYVSKEMLGSPAFAHSKLQH